MNLCWIIVKWTLYNKLQRNSNHNTTFGWVSAHYNDIIMSVIASQITSLSIVYSTVYSDADQRKHQSSASLAFVWGIHWWPVNSPHKGPVLRKMFPFDDVIMKIDVTPLLAHCLSCINSWICFEESAYVNVVCKVSAIFQASLESCLAYSPRLCYVSLLKYLGI